MTEAVHSHEDDNPNSDYDNTLASVYYSPLILIVTAQFGNVYIACLDSYSKGDNVPERASGCQPYKVVD